MEDWKTIQEGCDSYQDSGSRCSTTAHRVDAGSTRMRLHPDLDVTKYEMKTKMDVKDLVYYDELQHPYTIVE